MSPKATTSIHGAKSIVPAPASADSPLPQSMTEDLPPLPDTDEEDVAVSSKHSLSLLGAESTAPMNSPSLRSMTGEVQEIPEEKDFVLAEERSGVRNGDGDGVSHALDSVVGADGGSV